MTHSNTAIATVAHGIAGLLWRFTRTKADQRPDTSVVRTSANRPIPNKRRDRLMIELLRVTSILLGRDYLCSRVAQYCFKRSAGLTTPGERTRPGGSTSPIRPRRMCMYSASAHREGAISPRRTVIDDGGPTYSTASNWSSIRESSPLGTLRIQ